MKTPLFSVGCFVLASLLGAVGQFFYKSGADRAGATLGGYLGNARLWIGAVCYVAVMILFVAAFKRGGALSALYPIYATTFIFAAVISWWAYGIPIRPVHICGMGLLIVGMYLMGRA